MHRKKRTFLPHISRIDYYQFVTFRTFESIDSFLQKIRGTDLDSTQKEYLIDNYIDTSPKGNYLNGEILQYLKNFLLSQRSLYNLVSFTIMPNHVHLFFQQKEELAKSINLIKGTSAYHINKMLGRKGKFWEDSYYDRVIRDEKHLETAYNYIRNNPIKANLQDAKERYYSIYELE